MNPAIQQLHHKLSASLQGLDAAQTQLHPIMNPQKWSIQQIADHLLLTYASTANLFERRIAKGIPTQSQPTSSQRIQSFVVLQLGYMPTGRIAPEAVRPASTAPLSGEELTQRAAKHLLRLDANLDQAESLFGLTRAIPHTILGPMCARDWRRFHCVHGDHHIRQILAIRRDLRI
jgi:DinB superfamily